MHRITWYESAFCQCISIEDSCVEIYITVVHHILHNSDCHYVCHTPLNSATVTITWMLLRNYMFYNWSFSVVLVHVLPVDKTVVSLEADTYDVWQTMGKYDHPAHPPSIACSILSIHVWKEIKLPRKYFLVSDKWMKRPVFDCGCFFIQHTPHVIVLCIRISFMQTVWWSSTITQLDQNVELDRGLIFC